MGTVLTIPLYKIVCSLSDIEYDSIYTVCSKEYLCTIVNDMPKLCTYLAYGSALSSSMSIEHCTIVQCMCLNTSSEFVTHANIVIASVLSEFVNFIPLYIDMRFISRVSNFSLLEFTSLQSRIIVNPGDTTLVFFRMYNPTTFDIVGTSLYYIFPVAASVYLKKIQCFCFDLLQINSYESVELPVLFYISSYIDMHTQLYSLVCSYIFFV
jgi:cytochrome c oxidase assembly protein Cox11